VNHASLPVGGLWCKLREDLILVSRRNLSAPSDVTS
jgi:hypothetical protein